MYYTSLITLILFATSLYTYLYILFILSSAFVVVSPVSNFMSGLAPSTPSANKLEEAIVGANKTNRRLARELDTPPSSSCEGPPPKRLRPAVVHEVNTSEMVCTTEVLEKYIA